MNALRLSVICAVVICNLTGCQNSQPHTNTNNSTTTTNNASTVEILRYPIQENNHVFLSGRHSGYLYIKQDCLGIDDGQGNFMALALPIVPANPDKWHVFWDNDKQALHFEDKVFKKGQYLDLGGGSTDMERMVTPITNCQSINAVFGAFNIDDLSSSVN